MNKLDNFRKFIIEKLQDKNVKLRCAGFGYTPAQDMNEYKLKEGYNLISIWIEEIK